MYLVIYFMKIYICKHKRIKWIMIDFAVHANIVHYNWWIFVFLGQGCQMINLYVTFLSPTLILKSLILLFVKGKYCTVLWVVFRNVFCVCACMRERESAIFKESWAVLVFDILICTPPSSFLGEEGNGWHSWQRKALPQEAGLPTVTNATLPLPELEFSGKKFWLFTKTHISWHMAYYQILCFSF